MCLIPEVWFYCSTLCFGGCHCFKLVHNASTHFSLLEISLHRSHIPIYVWYGSHMGRANTHGHGWREHLHETKLSQVTMQTRGGPIIGCIKFEGTSTGNNVFVPTKHGSFLKLWIHQFPAWVSSMAKNKSWPTRNVIKHGNGKSTIYI